ncbi:putative phage holin [Streptomyces microflavus]|uniref:putative phage holin n=1 Tax=Streptomyces microflavus TaxID=1919 RepID=UPI003B21CE71
MSFAQILNLAVSALVFVCSAAFVVTYHLMAHWRRTYMGWHLMLFTGAIGLLGLYTVVVTITGLDGTPAMVLRYVRSALLLLVAGLMIQRTWMVWTAQHRPARPTYAPDSRTGDTP